ncbi:MAG: Ig-like domain-containing protein, partial [Nitrospinaceae bacterium]|nr:Ig-like domain-containing protein [Nitrospinaceae bacterium]
SCVKFASPPAAAGHDSGVTNQKFTLDPVDNLSAYTTYQVRVEPEVEDVLENTMTSQYTHSNAFRTSAFSSTTPTSGVFVAVGQYASSFRSIDNGTSWENETCSFFTTSKLNGVTYANNTFVAVGDSGKIVNSTNNASSWQVSTSSPSIQLNGVAFGGSTFDAVGGSGGYTFNSSNNGSSWTSRGLVPYSGSSYYRRDLYGVAFGNSTF